MKEKIPTSKREKKTQKQCNSKRKKRKASKGSPTNVSEETELVTFYDELSSLVRSIPKHNMLVIGGDMNAQIGKTETTNTASTTRQIGMGNI